MEIAQLLRSANHDAVTVLEQRMRGASDSPECCLFSGGVCTYHPGLGLC
ncbi:MAG: hypothetical protein M3014_15355 [Chloroflexota bacterium]|nr:hypothetical protein [Chloroflexota bacterium]